MPVASSFQWGDNKNVSRHSQMSSWEQSHPSHRHCYRKFGNIILVDNKKVLHTWILKQLREREKNKLKGEITQRSNIECNLDRQASCLFLAQGLTTFIYPDTSSPGKCRPLLPGANLPCSDYHMDYCRPKR